MIYVVGSGPAGVSCAVALIQQGMDVTMLDAGVELESTRTEQIARLHGSAPEEWRQEDLAFLKDGMTADIGGIPLKYAYGSDFPYRDAGMDWHLELEGVDTRPSFAKGGLSNVWGAAILPYRSNDVRHWPIGERELSTHYRAVLDFMPLSGKQDRLERAFPLYTKCPQPMRHSGQIRDFLDDLDGSADELDRVGISSGSSRLALWGQTAESSSGCRQCGLCMYGCPYAVIYSSAHTLDRLRKDPHFTYRPHVAVDKLVEDGQTITLVGRNLSTRTPLTLKGSRVFLACGVLPTTKILLESLEAFDEPVLMKDSAYFLLPLLRYRRATGVSREPLHTLAHVFLEIIDAEVCSDTVHLQVYGYNELYAVALRRLLGPLSGLLRAPSAALLERLLLIQGYLPSAYSSSIRTTLRRDATSARGRLHLTPVFNELTAAVTRRVVRKLRRSSTQLRAIPLQPLLRSGKPGRSYHSGGTFPMHASPGRFQSDRHGRPYGFTRVHAVDSTVFPNVPATTITLSVMANAHRIGSAVREY